MAFKFNPITGNLDLVGGSSSSGSSSDNHSGYYEIISSNVVEITLYKQSVSFGTLTLEGELQIDGQLIVEI